MNRRAINQYEHQRFEEVVWKVIIVVIKLLQYLCFLQCLDRISGNAPITCLQMKNANYLQRVKSGRSTCQDTSAKKFSAYLFKILQLIKNAKFIQELTLPMDSVFLRYLRQCLKNLQYINSVIIQKLIAQFLQVDTSCEVKTQDNAHLTIKTTEECESLITISYCVIRKSNTDYMLKTLIAVNLDKHLVYMIQQQKCQKVETCLQNGLDGICVYKHKCWLMQEWKQTSKEDVCKAVQENVFRMIKHVKIIVVTIKCSEILSENLDYNEQSFRIFIPMESYRWFTNQFMNC